jgi:hypothetical protein
MTTCFTRGIWLVFSSVGVLLCACSSSKTSQPPVRCSSLTPCETGFICIEGFCRKSCTDKTECSDGMICSAENYCVKPCQKKEDCADYEQCLDGICELACVDNDGDGYGNYCERGDDCDDTKSAINPGQGEIADDGIDNNCNGKTDEAEWEQYPICDNEPQSVTRIAPNFMLILDDSGSMRWSMNCPDVANCPDSTEKIVALRNAVAEILKVNANGTVIRFGLTTFPHDSPCGNEQVSVVPNNTLESQTIITNTVNNLTPVDPSPYNYNTPTGPTLELVNNNIYWPDPSYLGRDNYILLVTDGLPNCADGLRDFLAEQRALDAVVSLYNNHVKTFVIGIGEDLNVMRPGLLNEMADAGGMPRNDPTDPDTHYYPAQTTDELINIFSQIGQSVIGCKISTAKDPQISPNLDIDRLYMIYNDGNYDIEIPRDTTNGFEYVGDYTFMVYGTYCEKMNTGAINNLRIIMSCHSPY